MLSVILLILKITGIVIISIIGLILLLLCLILFVPIRYNFFLDYHDNLTLKAEAYWLLRLVRIKAWFENEIKYKGKIFIFTIFKSEDDKDNQNFSIDYEDVNTDENKGNVSGNKIKNVEHTVFDGDDQKSDDQNEAVGDDDKKSIKDNIKQENVKFDEFADEEFVERNLEKKGRRLDLRQDDNKEINLEYKTNTENVNNINGNENYYNEGINKNNDNVINKNDIGENNDISFEKKIFGLIRKISGKIKEIFRLINATLKKSKLAKDKLIKKISNIKAMIEDEENQLFVKFMFERIKELFRAIRPRKYNIDLHIGFDDPYIMGKVLMYVSAFYGMSGLDIKLEPEFDKNVKEGTIWLKGHIRLIWILIVVIKVFMNKKFRDLVLK